MSKYILTDPNFSDGANQDVIDAIVGEFKNRKGVKLIGYEPDPDFDRLPLEVLGEPEAVKEAIIAAAGKAYELINMEEYTGFHPHIGAFDTCEIYNAKGMSEEELKAFAVDLAETLHEKYNVPIYYTGLNATRPENEGLTAIREGNYKGAKEAVKTDPNRAPDVGPAELHPTAGATVVGALKQHDAYFNVMLDTPDVEIAKKLARHVRGRTGGFTNIEGTIGLPQTHRRTGIEGSMVSCEISRPLDLPLHQVYNLLKSEAERYGVTVLAGQVCGTIGAEVLIQTAEWYLQLEGINGPWDYEQQVLENHILDLQ